MKVPDPNERPQMTFYYERPNGSVFACGAKEADLMHRVYKQVGVSDGLTFRKYLMAAINRQNSAIDALNKKYKSKTKKYWDEREKIAERARKDLIDAEEAEWQVAKGKKQKPPDNRGTIEGKGRGGNTGINNIINAFINRR